MSELDELRERLAEVEAREREVARRERGLAARGLRHNLYDRVDVSVRTMDIVIAVCAAAIAGLIVLGVCMR